MESDTNQKIEEAEAFKTKGNELFKGITVEKYA